MRFKKLKCNERSIILNYKTKENNKNKHIISKVTAIVFKKKKKRLPSVHFNFLKRIQRAFYKNLFITCVRFVPVES